MTDNYKLCENSLVSFLRAKMLSEGLIADGKQVTQGSDENLSIGGDYHIVVSEDTPVKEKLSSEDLLMTWNVNVDLYRRWIGEEASKSSMTDFRGKILGWLDKKPAYITAGTYAVPGAYEIETNFQPHEFNFIGETPTPAFISQRVNVSVFQIIQR